MTLEQGLAIQEEHLKEWMPKLSAACWNDLVVRVRAANEHLRGRIALGEEFPDGPGYRVLRGTDITGLVHCWSPNRSIGYSWEGMMI